MGKSPFFWELYYPSLSKILGTITIGKSHEPVSREDQGFLNAQVVMLCREPEGGVDRVDC